jgi:hypothetical protein
MPQSPASRRDRDVRAEARRRDTAERDRRGRNAPWRRRFRIVRRRVGDFLLWLLAPALLRALAWSWRVERHGVEHLAAVESGGFLAAMWHGRMLPPLPLHRGRGIGVLVSPSDDGSLVAKLLERFGYRVIRGSSNKRGARALRDMRNRLESGGSVVITPDGPRGPRHSMNTGLAWLARETGLPILTVAVASDRAWRLRSWDRFLIPKPRARVAVRYGAPVRVPDGASDAELERVTEAVRAQLLDDERSELERLGQTPDW